MRSAVVGRCGIAVVDGPDGRDELCRDGKWLTAQGQQDRLGCPVPRRRAVSMTERTSAWSFAPQTDRKQLVTLRKTALQRSACSEPLLVGAASGSTRKTNSLPCHLTKLRRNFSVATLPTIGCATISESARKWRQK